MNKILETYIECIRKRLITDRVGAVDAALAFGMETWKKLVTTRSRKIIESDQALKEALDLNGMDYTMPDWQFRQYLKDQENR